MPSFDSIKGYKIQQKKDFIQEKGKLEQFLKPKRRVMIEIQDLQNTMARNLSSLLLC